MSRKAGRFVDLSTRIGQSSSGVEEIYDCPYCEAITGRAGGRVYYNVIKDKGWCFRCETPVFDDRAPTFEKVAQSCKRKTRGKDNTRFQVISWTTPVRENAEAYKYLQSRGVTDDHIDRFRLRACSDPFHGIVIPDRDLGGGETDFFQVRRIGGLNGLRYSNPSGASKWIWGVSSLRGRETAILCEGFFSAVSCADFDEYDVLHSYGKSISTRHLGVIRDLPAGRIIVLYDGGQLASSLLAAKRIKMAGKDAHIAFLPLGKDPNEIDSIHLLGIIRKLSVQYSALFSSMVDRLSGGSADMEDYYRDLVSMRIGLRA